MTEPHKRALIAAYYLSRFDRKGVRSLGYTTAEEAFTRIGDALGVKKSTVKHMRDSFDPYCSQVRAGWHQRPILRSRANVIEAYAELGEAAMAEIVHKILEGSAEATQLYTAPIAEAEPDAELTLDETSPFASRMQTGEKAERFFMEQFPSLALFEGSTLEDTRLFGSGFDFRAILPSTYRAIEVKGVVAPHGYISFTDKEWSVAHILRDNYILALVRSLNDQPILDLIVNPVEHVRVKMHSIESVAIRWNAKV